MRPGSRFRLRRLVTDEDGPTSAEYAVLLALLLGAIVLIVTSLGHSVRQSWERSNTSIAKAIGS